MFDLSQTDPIPGAPPLPIRPADPQLLTGQAPLGLVGRAGTPGRRGGLLPPRCNDPGGGARGRTNHLTRQVEVNPDLDPAQRVKTLAHELGHVLLHTPDQVPVAELHQPNGRGRVEVEAESVAFLVAAARGLDTSSYTFAYVGGWMPNKENLETTLRDTAARVLGTAHGILDRLDRDQPDLTIPAEDRPAASLRTEPAVDGARVAQRAGVSVDPGRTTNLAYGDRTPR